MTKITFAKNNNTMDRSNFFKLLLILQTIGLWIYTFFVFKSEGSDLFNVFTKNIFSMNWSGQFNLDFVCYLILSGIWIVWRNKFNFKSVLTGLLAMILGIIFFAPYLLWLTKKENGNIKHILIGDR